MPEVQMTMSDKVDLYLFRWMVEQRLNVGENSAIDKQRSWAAFDVDGEIVGRGETAIRALEDAHDEWESSAEHRESQKRIEDAIDRADHLRDVEKDSR